uniref:Uncharacterized protein n=1 Tax=Arundo donax TaxID=35708 RepID=A0A0A9HR99_ARUDO
MFQQGTTFLEVTEGTTILFNIVDLPLL